MPHTRRRLLELVAAGGASLAGCLGGGGGGGGPPSTPSPTATASSTPSPSPPPTPSATGTPSEAVVLLRSDDTFDPVRLEVPTGTTVTWQNTESGYYADHTVTAATFHDAATSWEFDVELGGGETASHTFESPGVYEYECTIHGRDQMCGAVLVGGATLDGSLPCE